MRNALLMILAVPLWAQQTLSLKDAVNQALARHPSLEAASAAVRAAEARRDQAKAGRLPRVSYSESWQRSDNPVFVFSSLLTQRQFGESNFAIRALNNPDAMNSFQSQVVADQVIWDAGITRRQTNAADLGRQLTVEDERRARMAVMANVVKAYNGLMLGQESLRVARDAVRSAQADRERAANLRAAGMATDADVLAIDVHVAAMREQEIRRGYDVQLAQAALNEALGLPLETVHSLTTALSPVPLPETLLAEREAIAKQSRPEARQVKLATSLAETQSQIARAARLPQVGFRFAFEADRQRFVTRAGANWLAAVSLRWNIFDGFADKARIAEANQAVAGSRARERQIEAALRLDVRHAHLDLQASQERIGVAEATVAQAEESLRIVKNRYENGLSTVTELLRSETALAETRLRLLAAVHDQRLAAAALELADGTLSPDSSVLN
jgi:outer membrane protein TolC